MKGRENREGEVLFHIFLHSQINMTSF